MAYFTSSGIGIAGISCAVPDNYFGTDDFVAVFGKEAVEKFSAATGISTVRKALPDQTASDLAYAAADNLLKKKNIDRKDIGILIFVTQSPDYRRPSSACVLQYRLGLSEECAAFEIGLGCSGFVYGYQTASSLLEDSKCEYALLMIAETASKLVNPQDKSIAMMYGDAGAAILLKKDSGASSCTLLQTDGSRFKSIILPAGGFRDMNPPHDKFMCSDGIERSLYDIFMDGTSVFSFSITDIPKALRNYLEHTGTTAEDYDVFVFHQANQFILKQLAKRLHVPNDKLLISLDEYGNTGGVSIPLTICRYYGESEEEKEISALTCGFGIGLSWGAVNIKFNAADVYPIEKTSDFYEDGKIKPGAL